MICAAGFFSSGLSSYLARFFFRSAFIQCESLAMVFTFCRSFVFHNGIVVVAVAMMLLWSHFFYLSTPSFVIQFCVWFCEICFEFESVERFYCILCVVAFVIQFLSTRTASLSHSFSFLSWVALDVHSSPHTYTLFSRLSFYSLMYL